MLSYISEHINKPNAFAYYSQMVYFLWSNRFNTNKRENAYYYKFKLYTFYFLVGNNINFIWYYY